MGSGGSSGGNAIMGGLGLIAAPFTGGLSLGLTAAAIGNYAMNKQEKGMREASTGLNQIIEAPTPPPAAATATLAQAAGRTQKAQGTSKVPTAAKAAGTIGALGPQGLVAPPQTANVTLLGGTK